MINKIDMGTTSFEDLHQVFKISAEELEAHKARLFPIGNTSDETSTTSIFLSSLSAVKEYREELLLGLDVGKIKNRNVQLHAYTEVPSANDADRPDGLLVITSGKRNPIIEWACFVEVKVGNNDIFEEQIERYTDFARDIGINNIITISNQLVTTPFDSPVSTNKRSFNLYHWSWQFLKVTASHLVRTDRVEDEDHVYILTELRRYFDSHRNVKNFVNMGKDWSTAIMSIHEHSVSQKVANEPLSIICDAYIQEEKDVALQLTDKSDYYIQLVSKGDREEDIIEQVQSSKVITSTYMIENDRKNTFSIEVDLIRHTIRCSTQLAISKGKAQAQTTAMLKMFEAESGYTDSIYIDAVYPRNRQVSGDVSIADLLNQKRDGEPYSILNKDFGEEIKVFTVRTKDMLGKDFKAAKNFITKLEDIAYRFLTQVSSNIKR